MKSAASIDRIPVVSPRLLTWLLVTVALLLLFRDTATAMVAIWIRSETFTHAFLVPPIVVWLVWRRRAHLMLVETRPAPWVLLPMAAVCALWVLAELASVAAATQFALVTLVVLSVPAVFGWAMARSLAFPLAFLYFAVPVGEFLVPIMMEGTADFTVAALQFTGVPVLRDGLQFVIPTGNWSVVEACSGVRYLIASFMVGTLFAYLNYRSTQRRIAFALVSLAVPIVANWLRAYIIVMLGHLSGNKIAAGADHLIYGWVFFGIVIGLMFMIGARWSEPEEPAPDAAAVVASAQASGTNGTASSHAWAVSAAVLLLLVATQGLVWKLDQPSGAAQPTFALAASAAGDWRAATEPVSAWQPQFQHGVNASASYAKGDSRIGVFVAYYRDQGYERKLVGSGNTLTEQTAGAAWAQVENGTRTLARTAPGADAVAWRTAVLRGSADPGRTQAPRLRVWHLYWVGGALTPSEARAKLHLATNRLLGRGDDGAALFVYAPLEDAADPAAADARIGDFLNSNLEPLLARLQAEQARR